MNKTIGTIGAATLLLGSLVIVQARDTITRQEFEQAAHQLEKGAKEGMLSEQDAKAIWHGIERAEVGEKLKAAVAAGKMTEEDAKAKWEAFEKKGKR